MRFSYTVLSISLCIAFLFLISTQSIADYGEAFLLVRCDSKGEQFEVEPRIIWNEELDVLKSKLEQGHGRIQVDYVQFLNVKRINSEIEESCTISGKRLKVIVSSQYDRELQLFENNNLITAPKIDDVWTFYGFVFKVRYVTGEGWKEFCGREEWKNNMWQSLDRKRADTNCREPIKAPNQVN